MLMRSDNFLLFQLKSWVVGGGGGGGGGGGAGGGGGHFIVLIALMRDEGNDKLG